MTQASSTIHVQEPEQLQPLAGSGDNHDGQRPPVASSPQDGGQDWHPFDHIVFDDPDEELVFPVIPIRVEDEIHTAENNYCCDDPTCDCAAAAAEEAQQ